MEVNKIIQGDCLEVLKALPDNSINCCITSPPYYGLRDYGTGIWEGGDPNCNHVTDGISNNRNFINEGGRGGNNSSIGGTICKLCGAVKKDMQIGLEETPEEYINKLVAVFREVKRALKPEGTLWVNIGDSYAGGAGRWGGTENIADKQITNNGSLGQITSAKKWEHKTIKPKDLIGIPWMLAFALRNDGWYLRQDIIWHKPNPMPESVKDRCTKSHEYIFLLSKSPKYYFDYEAIQEGCVDVDTYKFHRYNLEMGADSRTIRIASAYKDSKFSDISQESGVRAGLNKFRGNGTVEVRNNLPDKDTFLQFIKNIKIDNIVACGVVKTTAEHWYRKDDGFSYPTVEDWSKCRELFSDVRDFEEIDKQLTDVTIETDAVDKNSNGMRNKRDVWSVTPAHYKEAHFATFPEELIQPMILAGCPKGGIVLDPFMGSGTTAVVAKKNHRNYLGCELNPEYIKMAENRINTTKKRLF